MEEHFEPIRIRVSDRILLKQVEITDSKDIFDTIDSQREYLGRWLPFVKNTLRIEDSEAFIRSLRSTSEENLNNVFVIHYNGLFAGLIGFKGTDAINKKTEIGYWLSESFQKKGIITDSVKTLVDYAFVNMDINRIQIKCAVGNSQSRNIPLRLGFKFEGVERDGELLSGDVFADLEVFSRLRNENI